ncbi:MFS transporter, CP family, cyanate transporter [Streptoalloteichus tenebrarius]|uniref:MFS transporter, CP family, cyanate transporter n=1 Tax=Streptoalloteichus tenebrarius (strain ATCC 17920 / DSM 40477 / JCM 4838 / CBS 697.72 / NBRC 16177 / NCIMB 11028 / NRRL B-12390 / A12253. 1 / ISP 5477) TaxID=1933 RepID=A0ABT1HUL9_STRSD|nr:MFS transporter [Streptoalloteichus tenebrarius]MCP2259115.1 MFS transporter, CP family, cyanate transporter [Streptoalloteichus tenebrarius]BFE99559.1 MFS transporter [Streptoalloteichus tenebrarius]
MSAAPQTTRPAPTPAPAAPSATVRRGTRHPALVVVAILLTAASLRPLLTAVGPLTTDIQHATGLPGSVVGLLTTIPLAVFALASSQVNRLARRHGIEAVLVGGMLVLTAGGLLRWLPGAVPLFAGTTLLAFGLVVGNVLLPGIVRRDFPHRVGAMTSLYTTVMSVGAGVAAGAAVPLAHDAGLGWRGTLNVWVVVAVLALVAWLPLMRERHVPDASAAARPRRLWTSPLAWQVTVFFGLHSMLFYVCSAWLPSMLGARGLSPATAGTLGAAYMIAGAVASLVVPVVANRRPDQRMVVAVIVAGELVGALGVLVAGGPLLVASVTLLGLAGGAGFALSFLLFAVRAGDGQTAAQLSGMAQGVGYALSATGPLLFGLLHDALGGWTGPIVGLVVIPLVVATVGFGAARAAHV